MRDRRAARQQASADDFEQRGVAMIEHAVTGADLSVMSAAFNDKPGQRQSRLPTGLIAWLSSHRALSEIVHRLTGASAQLVRIIAFDKTPAANWFVPWHQDRSIALKARKDIPGFSKWTVKDGTAHVEPPPILLSEIATLRVHLDRCDESDGPLEVLPGSHRMGPLPKAEIDRVSLEMTPAVCLAEPGDVMAMRPLLIHRSQRARQPNRRRVLHLEYCSVGLPGGLEWALEQDSREIH